MGEARHRVAHAHIRQNHEIHEKQDAIRKRQTERAGKGDPEKGPMDLETT